MENEWNERLNYNEVLWVREEIDVFSINLTNYYITETWTGRVEEIDVLLKLIQWNWKWFELIIRLIHLKFFKLRHFGKRILFMRDTRQQRKICIKFD